MLRIGGADKTTPHQRLQSVFQHHASNPLRIDLWATPLQFPLDSPVPIPRKLGLNPFDLIPQFRILALSFRIIDYRLIVIGAGRQTGHFESFRN